MGVPAVQIRYFSIMGKPPAEPGLFNKKGKTLEKAVLNCIICGIKDEDFRKNVPSENLVAPVPPFLLWIGKNSSRI